MSDDVSNVLAMLQSEDVADIKFGISIANTLDDKSREYIKKELMKDAKFAWEYIQNKYWAESKEFPGSIFYMLNSSEGIDFPSHQRYID